MSDLFTDASREERRYAAHISFLEGVAAELNGVPNMPRSELNMVANTAGLRHDLGPDGLDGLIATLKAGNEDRWLWILDEANGTQCFQNLQECSPFRNTLLLFGRRVRYGSGIELDVSQLKTHIVRAADAYDMLPERFAVSMPLPASGATRIIKKK